MALMDGIMEFGFTAKSGLLGRPTLRTYVDNEASYRLLGLLIGYKFKIQPNLVC